MKKIDFKKIGLWGCEMLRNNSSTIVGGLSMIGLALLCRKLNIPYTVLTDGYSSRDTYSSRDLNTKPIPLMYLPSDPIEASISAIYDSSERSDFDSQRVNAAKEIMAILAAHEELPESTLTYAISTLRTIAGSMDFDSGRREITKIIAKIGKGEF